MASSIDEGDCSFSALCNASVNYHSLEEDSESVNLLPLEHIHEMDSEEWRNNDNWQPWVVPTMNTALLKLDNGDSMTEMTCMRGWHTGMQHRRRQHFPWGRKM
ncbi:hypothetical protein HN51_063002 [Arachis hypogaea]|uniref:uncharacterized protein LOC110271826 n=1 Tax=Arachis ipaensis TaxID=130454 RepID=UPI000A2B9845|nr:uncharacterized protein LOC110271826 [Arachis ipaensis]